MAGSAELIMAGASSLVKTEGVGDSVVGDESLSKTVGGGGEGMGSSLGIREAAAAMIPAAVLAIKPISSPEMIFWRLAALSALSATFVYCWVTSLSSSSTSSVVGIVRGDCGKSQMARFLPRGCLEISSPYGSLISAAGLFERRWHVVSSFRGLFYLHCR